MYSFVIRRNEAGVSLLYMTKCIEKIQIQIILIDET